MLEYFCLTFLFALPGGWSQTSFTLRSPLCSPAMVSIVHKLLLQLCAQLVCSDGHDEALPPLYLHLTPRLTQSSQVTFVVA